MQGRPKEVIVHETGSVFKIFNESCRKLMKCPLILTREMAPFNLGYSEHRTVDIRRLYDAILYGRHGEGYENPRSYSKGRFQANPLD